MTHTSENDSERLAQRLLNDDTQFVKAVTSLADRQEVVASENIYASNGMKLLNKGAYLSGHFYDHLVAHKLLKPIGQSLVASQAPCANTLVTLAHAECRRIPSLVPLMEQPDLLERMLGFLGGVRIPAPLALRLAVMRDDRPKLFQHSLIVAMLSVVLGVRAKLPIDELQALALASIFHDIGELCIAPDLLAEDHRLSDEERRYLFTHPITGFLMLRDFRDLPTGTARAVLQHHERLDGSGYPNRIPAEQITRVTRYLSVAEFVASLLEKNGADRRIGMKLRLNDTKFDRQAVALICQLLHDAESKSTQAMLGEQLTVGFAQVRMIFEGWSSFQRTLSPADKEGIAYLVERMGGLRAMVLEIGFDECRLHELIPTPESKGEVEIRTELSVLFDELMWQFRALSREIERKIFVQGWSLKPSRRKLFNQWLAIVRQFAGEPA